jgi:outer membrane protein assembly factor BamB
MGKWFRRPEKNPQNPPVPLTPIEREIAAEEALIAEEIRALEAELPAAIAPHIPVPIIPAPLPTPSPPEPVPPLNCTPVLYVTGADGYLYALDPQTGELRWKVQVVERESSNFYMFVQTDPETGRVYISDYVGLDPDDNQVAGNELVVVQSGAVFQRISVPNTPTPPLIDTLHNRLYVAGLGFDTSTFALTQIDLSSGTVIASITTGSTTPSVSGNAEPIVPLYDPLTGEVFYVGAYMYGVPSLASIAIWRVNPDPLSLTLLHENANQNFQNATFDYVHRKIYYTTGSSIVMYDIDTDTASIFSTDEESLTNLIWDPGSGLIYGIGRFTDGSDLYDVFIFDPAQPYDPLPTYGLYQNAQFTYGMELDAERHILYVTDTNGDVVAFHTNEANELFRVNIGTIAVDVKLGTECE